MSILEIIGFIAQGAPVAAIVLTGIINRKHIAKQLK